MPILGRILNSDGQPVGGARLAINKVRATTNDGLDDFIDAVKSGDDPWAFLGHTWIGTVSGLPEEFVTDSDGRFEIKGLGADRVLLVDVEGAGIDKARLSVMTRMSPPTHGPNLRRSRPNYPVYGAAFDHIGSPARTIRGLAHDKQTGTRVPGARAIFFYHGVPEATESDEQGRFEFEGVVKQRGYRLSVSPTDVNHFAQIVYVQDSPGLDPIEVSFDLMTGIRVTGRVTDGQTGNPTCKSIVLARFAIDALIDDIAGLEASPTGVCSSSSLDSAPMSGEFI